MAGFHNFTAPIREIFAGNLLLLFCCLLYLVWWIVAFKPNSSSGSVGVYYIIAAFITGVASIALMAGGINSLSQVSHSLPVRSILLASAALFIVLLLVTVIIFHRIVTSELIIIHIWAVLELSAVAVLYGTGQFAPGRAAALAVLVGIAFAASLICYVLYYRLDGMARYWDGMIPLIMAVFVIVVFLGALAVS